MQIPTKFKNRIRILFKRAETLRKMVHAKDCRNPDECPEGHWECNEALDLFTALMWTAAGEIEKFASLSESSFSNAYYNDRLDGIIFAITALRRVLGHHSDLNKKTWKAYKEIRFAVHSMDAIKESIYSRFYVRV